MNMKQAAIAGLILGITVICGSANVGLAQIDGFNPLGNKASGELFTRADGGKIRAVIRIKVDSGWHLYDADKGHPKVIGTDTKITMGPESVKWSKVVFPKADRILQAPELAGPNVWINSHEGTVLLYAVGEVAGDASGDNITAKIDGQTCSDTSCMPYAESLKSLGRGGDALFAAFPANLSASDAPAATQPVKPAIVDTTDYSAVKFPDYTLRTGESGEHGLVVWFALAFLAGMLMNVMPCVLPVISIKILSFVQQAGESRGRMLALGSVFAAGMLLVYWALAIAAITLGLNWGEQFQSDQFMVVMITIVFAFGLSLLGVFTLGVPKQVNTLAAGIGREGLGNAFFNGMLATLLATPCSGPFLGGTLTWALSQTPLTIFLIFTMLGLGMALPYVVLTAFPKLLVIVPKPGPWMETFKQAMGFLLMVTVVYLMISVRSDMLLFVNAFLVFVGIACWYWGRFAKFGQSSLKRWITVVVTVVIVAVGAQLSFGTMRGAFAPTKPGQGHIDWVEFDPDAFNEHIKAGRTVFVDFSATWCPNCLWNEKMVFETDEISKLLKNKGVISMRADITHNSSKTRMLVRLRSKLGGRSLPFLAVFPGDRPNEPFVRPDIISVSTMREILNSVPDPKKETSD
ncbi:MAG: cytochrome c biogenesis protein CcdA [Phycisphaerae bacterium]|jgi:thiol:disulfide interchange protein DsbD|nr:cytochrome c biogenesis protein CcdA [Phycisphaerae bacterium]